MVSDFIRLDSLRVLILGGHGYIGSTLTGVLTSHGASVEVVDLQIFGTQPLPDGVKSRLHDYQTLTTRDLSSFDVIVLLAGYSGVPMALRDPFGAWRTNVTGFVELLQKLSGQRLIYASSSSVYSGCKGGKPSEEEITTDFVNVYDLSKFNNDKCAEFFYPNSVGLRFGTVCGASPNLRTDVMLNRMVLTALRDNVVNVANPQVFRPVLGMRDLCDAIVSLLTHPEVKGCVNLASFNMTVEEMGKGVASALQVPLQFLPNSLTYDFSIASDKITRETGFRFTQTLDSIVDDLRTLYRERGLHESPR